MSMKNYTVIVLFIFLIFNISGCKNIDSSAYQQEDNINNNGNNPMEVKYHPKTRKQLRKLVSDESVKLWEIDTSKITDMHNLFYQSGRKDFTGIENWNVSKVKDMSGIFKYTAINHNLNSWDTSNVENMHEMFFSAVFFNGDISSWDVSQVRDMSLMFEYAVRFNQNIGLWDVSNVKDMSRMFVGAKHFNQDIGNWNTENVVDMNRMFIDNVEFNQDISSWNVSSVENMDYMFCNAFKFNQDLSSWNISNVMQMENMFLGTPLENNPPVWYKGK